VNNPDLSVVCTLGPRRGRAERVLEALAAQSAADSIELVLMDAGPPEQPLRPPDAIHSTVLPHPAGGRLGEARARGLHFARGEIVAFFADHVYPEPGWAQALIAAYRDGPWAAVGYAFRNANPDTYGSRASMLADFAPWLVPTHSRETAYLPPNDLSFRRSVLLGLGDDLVELLTAEPLLLEELQRRGHRLAVAKEAVVAHACLRTVRDNALASFDYCRALAEIQVRREHWGIGRRLAQIVFSALGAPALRTVGTLRILVRGPSRGTAIRSLPGIAFQHLLTGLGQAWGCIAGGGDAASRFPRWELAEARDDP
jgi:hypothetical protein